MYLVGNPCCDWPHYRPFVIASVPSLKKLDGTEIKPSERIAAQQIFPELQLQLRQELIAEGTLQFSMIYVYTSVHICCLSANKQSTIDPFLESRNRSMNVFYII